MRRLVMILAAACLFTGNAKADARGDLAAGKEAHARGDDLGAIAKFGSAISDGLQGGELAEAYRERGRSYLRSGDLIKAAKDLDQAVALNPEDAETYGVRCRINLGLNNGKRAMADSDAAFARTKTSIAAQICRAEIMYAARRFKEALAGFDEAMRLGANDYQFRTSRALAMIWAGKPDDAIRELDVLIEASRGADGSTRAKLYEARARAKIAKGNANDALADATQAVEASEDSGILKAERHAFRARVHILRAEFDKAIVDVNAALGLLSGAREDRLAPLYATRAGAYASKGELERSISDFDEAIRRSKGLPGPQVASWYVGRGRANVALDRRPAAGQDFENAFRLDGRNPDILTERGDNKLYQGDAAGALADYDAAIALDPKSVAATNRRGWALIDQGKFEDAIAAAEKGLKLQPDNALGYWNRGVFRFLAGRFADAGGDFKRVVEATPKNMHAMMFGHIARERAGKADRNVLAREAQGPNLAEWPAPLVQVFLGTSTPEAAVAATNVDEAGRRRRRECEAHFYLGQYALLKNDKASAEDHFRKAVATDVRHFVEYTAARIELQRMGR